MEIQSTKIIAVEGKEEVNFFNCSSKTQRNRRLKSNYRKIISIIPQMKKEEIKQ